MKIFEVLQNAHYNFNENGLIGTVIGKQQFNNAMRQLEKGKDLHDEFEECGTEDHDWIKATFSNNDIADLLKIVLDFMEDHYDLEFKGAEELVALTKDQDIQIKVLEVGDKHEFELELF